jgi:hypothetical protein
MDYILGLISQFVLLILKGPLSQDQICDSFLAPHKHVYMGQVYTSACSAELKRTLLSLPLNDLACAVNTRLDEARRIDPKAGLHAVLDWVVACATHPEVDVNGELASKLKLHFFQKPALGLCQNNVQEQLAKRDMARVPGEPGHGEFPALTHALRRILQKQPPLRAASKIRDMLRAFVQIAMDATEARLVGDDFSSLREIDPEQWKDTIHGLE